MNYADYLKGIYDTQRAATNTAYETTAANLNTQITGADQTYQPQKNDAYVNQLMAQKRVQENMANAGLSAVGGTSETLQQRERNNLNTNLTNIDLAKQNYIQGLQSQISSAAVTRDSSLADIATQEGSAVLSAEESAFNRYYTMYKNGDISASQFTQMTGQPVTAAKSSGNGSSGMTAADEYAYYVGLGLDATTASALSGYAPADTAKTSYGMSNQGYSTQGLTGKVKKTAKTLGR
jgi:hypothetical protein